MMFSLSPTIATATLYQNRNSQTRGYVSLGQIFMHRFAPSSTSVSVKIWAFFSKNSQISQHLNRNNKTVDSHGYCYMVSRWERRRYPIDIVRIQHCLLSRCYTAEKSTDIVIGSESILSELRQWILVGRVKYNGTGAPSDSSPELLDLDNRICARE